MSNSGKTSHQLFSARNELQEGSCNSSNSARVWRKLQNTNPNQQTIYYRRHETLSTTKQQDVPVAALTLDVLRNCCLATFEDRCVPTVLSTLASVDASPAIADTQHW